MSRRLLGALQFLTVIPVSGKTVGPGESASFFPIVGALLGAVAGVVLRLLAQPLGGPLASLLALALLLIASGGLHEDGLADCADALRAGRTREKMVEILSDSRIGTYGAVALIISNLIRWQALVQMKVNPIAGLAASMAIARSSMVLLAIISIPVGQGLGAAFLRSLPRSSALATMIQMVAAGALCGWRGLAMIASTAMNLFLLRAYFSKRLGGVNGDCLGATCSLVETTNLVILAWLPSI